MITSVIEQDGLPGLPAPASTETPSSPFSTLQPPAGAGLPDPSAGDAPDGSESTGDEPGRNQPAIWDAEPEPRQLALIPDPDPWEADRPSPITTGPGERGDRLVRRRRRSATPPPGQLSLF